MLTSDIQIRDPFVVPVPSERRYYLYGTTDPGTRRSARPGFVCYRSADLVQWEGPVAAFRAPAGFWADQHFWAPEVHCYAGAYVMLASFKAAGVCRGTQVLTAGNAWGPFTALSPRPITPPDWECLDGSLFVDDEGQPWMLFCHEWVQICDGSICAVRLSPDLRQAVGEPATLFTASAAHWTVPFRWRVNGQPMTGWVTDGPFIHRLREGALLMLWSSFGRYGYTLGISRADNGKVTGPWRHLEEPHFARDGGHGMLFQTFEGQLMLAIHQPNKKPYERAVFLPLEERNGSLQLQC